MIPLLFVIPIIPPALRLFQQQYQKSKDDKEDESPPTQYQLSCDTSSVSSSTSSAYSTIRDLDTEMDHHHHQGQNKTMRSMGSYNLSTRSNGFSLSTRSVTSSLRQISPKLFQHFFNKNVDEDEDDDYHLSYSTARTNNNCYDDQSMISFHSRSYCCDELSCVQMDKLLGPKIDLDARDLSAQMQAANYVIGNDWNKPKNLEHVLEMDLPVGYYRLRKALLCSRIDFWDDMVLSETLKYSRISSSGWDKHDDVIGLPELPSHVQTSDIIGTTKTTQYLMPKTTMVRANMAYESTTITEYNSHCFAIEMKTTNPDVPYGNQFVAHTKIVVYNKGSNSCQMVCSVETIFPNGSPLGVGWQIKKGMKIGSMDVFEKIGSSIKECALLDDHHH